MKKTAQILVIILLIAASITLTKNIHSQFSRFKEIYRADREVRQQTQKKNILRKELDEVKSPFNLEKEARDKLGYQKPGEVLFVVPEQEILEEKAKEEAKKKNWEERRGLDLRKDQLQDRPSIQ